MDLINDKKEDEHPQSNPTDNTVIAPVPFSVTSPPEDIKQVIHKLAEYVVKHGKDFEENIKLKEQGNSKFEFLQPWSPYFGYYKWKIQTLVESTEQQAVESKGTDTEQKEDQQEQPPGAANPEDVEKDKKLKRLKKAKLFGQLLQINSVV